ncbi:peroxidase-related enzyme [Flavobacterium granuli]|uniref:Peroxidase-related enzyme n=1 Tax=Flavobacterium granuli TaxID=280093 RepID=A0ABU1S2G7_9FLAO|nr:peroxidase-related enzyme [Flavobacterium granuli]MDR6845211.1 putative peroxidase-related enzyme [Flavobacterium granuli]
MAYISLDETKRGMNSLLAFRPEIAQPLTTLMQILMRNNVGLSMGERELIAAFVSSLNDCYICGSIHAEVAQCLLNADITLIQKVKDDYQKAPISNKMKTLLTLAKSVQEGGKNVTEEQVAIAKNSGSTDMEIHDTVLIASLFCMFNRYVDGLGLESNDTMETFRERGIKIAQQGYNQ